MGKMKNVFEQRQRVQSRWYWRLINRIGEFINRHNYLYYILNYTWGLLNVIIGYLILLVLLPFGKFTNVGYGKLKYFKLNKETDWAFSIGTLIFSGGNASTAILAHEYGHTVQNAIFGPFTLLFVSIPSFIRFHYLNIKSKVLTSSEYDSIWFEGTATHIGLHYVYDVRFSDH